MHRRLLIASVAAYVVVMIETVAATPFSDIPQKLPSSLSVAHHASNGAGHRLWRDRIRPISQPRGLQSPNDRAIFPVSAAAPHSFIKAALDSSLELPQDGLAPSLADLITLASLRPADLPRRNRVLDPYGPVSEPARPKGVTVRDLMKSMVHRTGPSDPEPATVENGDKMTLENFLLTSVLETQLDMEFVNIVAGAVNPSIKLDGLITLDILGLREIAVLMSGKTDEIQVMDLNTRRFVSIGGPSDPAPSLQTPLDNLTESRGEASREPGENYALIQWINAAKKFIHNFLRHPLTLLTILVLSMLAMVRHIAQRI